MEKAKEEQSVNEHNAGVSKGIAALKKKIDALNKTFKSESEKPQASLNECNKLAQKIRFSKVKVK